MLGLMEYVGMTRYAGIDGHNDIIIKNKCDITMGIQAGQYVEREYSTNWVAKKSKWIDQHTQFLTVDCTPRGTFRVEVTKGNKQTRTRAMGVLLCTAAAALWPEHYASRLGPIHNLVPEFLEIVAHVRKLENFPA